MTGVLEVARFVIGVDPGKEGGFCLLDEDGSIENLVVMPTIVTGKKTRRTYDLSALRTFVVNHQTCHWFIEKSQPLPASMGGGFANYDRGLSSGGWEWGLNFLGVPFTMVAPRTWQREMYRDIPGEGKARARVACSRQWPGHDFRPTTRARVPHLGLCDAALIAEYGRRCLIRGVV